MPNEKQDVRSDSAAPRPIPGVFGVGWASSRREYSVTADFSVSIPVRSGITLDADVFRPSGAGPVPAILSIHPYYNASATVPAMPGAMAATNAMFEAGDPSFFARHGYAQVVINVQGTGRSGGLYDHYGPAETAGLVDAIEWVAARSWCDGKVGTFGVSSLAVIGKKLAALNPPALKAVFAPFGYTDFYRHKFYHGGILHAKFVVYWSSVLDARADLPSWTRAHLGDAEFAARLAAALENPDVAAVPAVAAALRNPDRGANPLLVDAVLNDLDGPYWQERSPDLAATRAPVYDGACWANYGLHLPGAFAGWEAYSQPKRMTIGPPIYLDRPVYQYAHEALRWFDHWLKGIDTKILGEPPVKLFIPGKNDWRYADSWPLPETRWTPFFLHDKGLLSEHEHWPHEGASSYPDNRFNAPGSLTFVTPPLVENTEIVGPIPLRLFVGTTGTDVLIFATLWDVAPSGKSRLLTRGWLRGSLRHVDAEKSTPWQFHHSFDRKEPLAPGEVYELDVNLVGTARFLPAGHRIALRISSRDDIPVRDFVDSTAVGHLEQARPSWVTVHHEAACPSVVHLPVVRGNVIGTYFSGGDLNENPEADMLGLPPMPQAR